MTGIDERAATLTDWLLGEGVTLTPTALLQSLALRLRAYGLPLDRFTTSAYVLSPSILAAGLIWRPDQEMEYPSFDYARRDSGMYERSPFKVAHETGEWVHVDVNATPEERFGILPDLKREGLAHYIALPLPDSSGGMMSLTMATKQADGFPEDGLALVRRLVPVIAAVVELKMLRRTVHDVLSAYVGRGPAEQIISGTIHRGEVSTVRAAILVADLRGFTHLSTQLPPTDTADLINCYYDRVVPPIAKRGGEVLKFIGDAVLAIFPTGTGGDAQAVESALAAAREALDHEAEPHVVGGRAFAIRYGIALHVGEAAFGNVGSGDRLDFTVIGRDVNIAARIAALCSRLGRDYLVSEEVAAIGRDAGRTMADAGSHEVRGLSEPLRVYVPDETNIGPEHDDGVSQGLALDPVS